MCVSLIYSKEEGILPEDLKVPSSNFLVVFERKKSPSNETCRLQNRNPTSRSQKTSGNVYYLVLLFVLLFCAIKRITVEGKRGTN